MTKKRYIAAILAALMIASMSACNSGTENETTGNTPAESTANEATTESDTEAEETTFSAGLAKQDYSGTDFRIYTSNTINGIVNTILINHADEQTGEILNDTLFNRDLFIEDNYNVKLQYTVDDETSTGAMAGNLSKGILAGDSGYELIIQDHAETARNLAAQSCIYPLNMVPGIQLDKEYWFPKVNSTSYIGDSLYFASSMISPRYYGSVYLMMFNRDLAENLGLEDIYGLVSDGKWTLDKTIELSRQAVNDANGDGTIDNNDTLGFFWDSHEAFIIGAGCHLVESENGHLVSKMDSEKMVNLFQKMVSFFQEEGEVWDGTEGYDNVFNDGNALFFNPCAFDLAGFRDLEYDFGILPMPKYDETQAEYVAFSQPWVNTTAIIPVTLTGDALAMVGIVTDGMVAYGYDYVRPAVFENVLMLKSTRDEQSAKIIDLIFQNVTVELSTSMYFGNFSSEIGQFFNRKLGQQDITSLYASVKDSLEASLKSTEEQYKEIAANLGK